MKKIRRQKVNLLVSQNIELRLFTDCDVSAGTIDIKKS